MGKKLDVEDSTEKAKHDLDERQKELIKNVIPCEDTSKKTKHDLDERQNELIKNVMSTLRCADDDYLSDSPHTEENDKDELNERVPEAGVDIDLRKSREALETKNDHDHRGDVDERLF